MPLGATIDRRVLHLGSDVGRHAQAPTFGDEAPRVIALVGTEREAALGARIMPLDHGECGLALGPARGPRRVSLDDQAMAVLCKCVADEAELCRHVRTLAIEFGVGIGGARVRGVATLFPMKSCARHCGLDPTARRSRLWLGSSSGSPMPRRAYRRPRNGRSTATASPRGEQERRP